MTTPQITVTITGPQGSGKTALKSIIENALNGHTLGLRVARTIVNKSGVRIVERTDAPYQGNPAHRFTPGSWSIGYFGEKADSIVAQDGATVVFWVSSDTEEDRANATLISQCPALLDRCEAAERMITNLISDIRANRLIHQHAADNLTLHRDNLRAVIAKATTV